MQKIITQYLITMMLIPSLVCGMPLCPANSEPNNPAFTQSTISHCGGNSESHDATDSINPDSSMLLADCADIEQAPPAPSLQLQPLHDSPSDLCDLVSLSVIDNLAVNSKPVIRGSPLAVSPSHQLPIYLSTLRLRL